MAVTPKIFYQLKPINAMVTSLLYQVPLNKQAQVTVFLANQVSNADYFSIVLVPTGYSESSAMFLAYDTPIIGNGVFAMSGICMSSGDQLRVKSLGGKISFTATGMEFS